MTYGYDAAGRTTSVATSAGTTTLGYDFESRLVSMSGPGIAATYAYNGLDARRGKTMNGVSRSYLRGSLPLTPAPLPPGWRGSRTGASVREYGATKYLHSGLKTADAQSSGSQSITGTRVYDAFGNLDSSSGSWTGALGYDSPYGYQSASEGGLMLLGHRYYDPSTGRFLTRDPVKDGRNWYAYVDGSPVKYADPTGLIRIGDFEFTLDVVIEGIKTGANGLANGMTGGAFGGDAYRHRPGFGFAVGAGRVAIGSLVGVGGVASIPRAKLIVGPNIPNLGSGTAVVIGNNMQRVQIAAGVLGGRVFDVGGAGKVEGWFKNLAWMLRQIVSKDFVIDIGPVPGSKPYGWWYLMERFVTRLLCD